MRARLLFMAVLLATTLTAAPGSAVVPVLAATCPASPTADQLIAMGWEHGPLVSRFGRPGGIGMINEHGRACYGQELLRFRAFVDNPPGIGGTSAYGIRPAWLASPALWIYAVDERRSTQGASARFTGLYVPPGLGNLQRAYLRTWVVIEAHFMDAAAQTCRATGAPGATPSRRQAIAMCEAELVVVSVSRAGAMPDTGTAPSHAEQEAADRWLVLIGVVAAIAMCVAPLAPGRRRLPRH